MTQQNSIIWEGRIYGSTGARLVRTWLNKFIGYEQAADDFGNEYWVRVNFDSLSYQTILAAAWGRSEKKGEKE